MQATVQVEGQTDAELVFLLAHDLDPFCRWEAGQALLRALLTKLYHAARDQKVGATAAHHTALLLPDVPLKCRSRCCFHYMQPDKLPVSANVQMVAFCGMCDVTKPEASQQQLLGGRAALNSLRAVLCLKEPKLEAKLATAGGVPESVVDALGSLLTSKDLDGMFIAAGISLPAATELIGDIPNIAPLLLHNVRWVSLLM